MAAVGGGQNLLAFDVNSARSPSDVYSWSPDAPKNAVTRWTTSETRWNSGQSLRQAKVSYLEIVRWPGTKSGFLYLPDPKTFPGPRPLVVNIHGGPESQARPTFAGRNKLFL